MRGRVIVIVMVLLGVLMYIYSLWFLGNPSTADQRFDMRREKLPAEIPGAVLLREKFGDFRRQAFKPVETDAQGVLRGEADYFEFDTKILKLEVMQIAPEATGSALQEIATRRQSEGTAVIHTDRAIKFLYFKGKDGRSTFYWINNVWLFSASSPTADEEAILRFANNYPF